MSRQSAMIVGTILILLGILSLFFTWILPLAGQTTWQGQMWRLWPLVVVGVGLLFVLPPLLVRDRRGLGALFIPGVPILTNGAILFFASAFDMWGAWAYLWPLEVLAVALGFLLAAIYMRTIWLTIPAIIIGLNGLLLQFCALTGLWSTWAVLWTIEPLSVGLAFLVVSAKTRSSGLFLAGLILFGLAGMGFVGMSMIFSGWWLLSPLGPAAIILTGLLLMLWGVLRRRPSLNSTPE